MSEEEYKELLIRVEENQRNLSSHADKKDEFSQVENRLVELLEKTKQRMVRRHGGSSSLNN